MIGRTARTTCPEWALRIYDGLAVVTLGFAAFALAAGAGAAEPAPEAIDRAWTDLAAAALLPVVLAFSIWLGRRRGQRDGDEYLRRLIGHSAAIGVVTTVVAWSSWTILAGSWVPAPGADQMIEILLGSSAVAYGLARLRDIF